MNIQVQRVSAFLLMLFLGISGANYLFYDVAQLTFKKEAYTNIYKKENLQTIKLAVNEFKKCNTGDELWAGGRLYDISSYVIVNDTAFVSVFHDEQEEGLIKSIVDSFEPEDKYLPDGSPHMGKHKTHVPDSDKMLPRQYAPEFISTALVNYPSPHFIVCLPFLYGGVIKPPPRA